MTLGNLMTRNPVTVSLDDTLGAVRDIFERHHFHHVLVVDGPQLVGVVSDRDLLKALSPNLGLPSETSRDLATLKKRVHQIMTRDLIVLKEDATVREAIELFNSHRISCIPIVDAHRAPVGILSWRDILKAIARGEPPRS